MSIQRPNYRFDAEDRNAYVLSLRRTLVAYGAMVLFAIALVTVQATSDAANVAEFASIAVAATGP
jgi:hypothetical protein